jgi:DNA polymerase I-like protein with 3'-5' exonuclease and polymerase domains
VDFFEQLEALNRPTVKKKPWMDSVEMYLATPDMLDKIAEECIESGLYGLDLETTGLDQRAFPNDMGKLETMDKVVGYCIAPTDTKGYYIPVRHREEGAETNVPPRLVTAMVKRINESGAVAVFFNAKFDHKFLMHEPAGDTGVWDEPGTWEDVRIANYVRNSRVKRNNLKLLAKEELDREMIELKELWLQERGKKINMDFSTLDPRWDPVVWYAAADAINTRALWAKVSPEIFEKDKFGFSSKTIYTIEKLCVTATVWMEQNRIHIDRDKLKHLIQEGQKEWWSSINQVYSEVSEVLDRDIRPPWVALMDEEFDPEVLSPDYTEVRSLCMKQAPADTREKVVKSVPNLTNPKERESVSFEPSYDVTIPAKFGMMLRELRVPGLVATEKSGQVKTSKDALEAVLGSAGDKFPWMRSVKRFREIQKALSNVLFNLWRDSAPDRSPDGCVWANFNGLKVDTGRFSTPTPSKKEFFGQANWNVQSTKSFYYDPKDPPPVCVYRQREVIAARPGHTLYAIDYSGVELRIVTNLSGEPKWMSAFFKCGTCGNEFPKGVKPPPFCPECGSDKIGDLHSETAIGVLGANAGGDPKIFKMKRQTAKIVNFLLCYGGSGNAVSNSTGCDEDEGWRVKNNFDKTYKGLLKWWRSQERDVKKQKYVRTVFGRKYMCPDIDHEFAKWRSKAKRNAVNGPVQGSSADIMKFAMALLYREFRKRGWLDKVLMTITIHDELVFEIRNEVMGEAIPVIDEIMCERTVKNLGWPIPLKVDVEFGPDWTVKNNLTEMMSNQGGGEWTEELVRFLPAQYANYLECGGKPLGSLPETPEPPSEPAPPPTPSQPLPGTERGVEGRDLSGNPVGIRSPDRHPPEPPRAEKAEGVFLHRIPNFKLTAENADKLSRLVFKCEGRGDDLLSVVSEDGRDLLGGKVRVSYAEFRIIASYEGL